MRRKTKIAQDQERRPEICMVCGQFVDFENSLSLTPLLRKIMTKFIFKKVRNSTIQGEYHRFEIFCQNNK